MKIIVKKQNITLYNLYLISSFGVFLAIRVFTRTKNFLDAFSGYILGAIIGIVVTSLGKSILKGSLRDLNKTPSIIIAWILPIIYFAIFALWLGYISLTSLPE